MSADWVGYLAATLVASVALPQAVRLARRRDPAGVNPWTWAAFTVGPVIWLTYGITTGAAPLIPGNVATATASAVVLATLATLGTPVTGPLLAAVAVLAAAGVGYATIGPAALGWIAVTIGLVVRLPQLASAARAPAIAGISATSWVVASAGSVCWHTFGWLTGDWPIRASSAASLTASVAIVAVVRARRHAGIAA